jgi:predicted O-methyltransferase YrrM
MTQELWTAVDRYVTDLLVPDDPVLEATLEASAAAGLPPHHVSPTQGKMLELLIRIRGARSVLELGTLGGYSTIWLARALAPGGRLVTLEGDARYAEVASANIEHAGLGDVVEVRVGRATETLSTLVDEDGGPFDAIFIDADKENNPDYLAWALRLSRIGTLIVADNVIRAGGILDPSGSDPRLGAGGIQGVRRFYELLAAEPRVSATAIQTVGSKGYDGFALALVTGEV